VDRLTRPGDLDDADLVGVAAAAAAAVGADGALLFLAEPDGSGLRAQVSDTGPVTRTLVLPSGTGVVGRVAEDRVAAVLVDDSPRNATHRSLLGLGPGQTVSRACLPVLGPSRSCLGVLAVHAQATRDFSPAALTTLEPLVSLLGVRLAAQGAAGQLAAQRAAWEELAAAAVAAQEAERRRVAAELHDGVTQTVASLAFHLSAAAVALEGAGQPFAAEQLRTARELADLALSEARAAMTGLRAPVLDDLGLAAGLESLARSIGELPVSVEVDPVDLADHVATALYRIAQEALHNAVRHAGATQVTLRLVDTGDVVVLTVSDDGVGFSPQRPSAPPPPGSRLGLAGMAERAGLAGGWFDVRASPGSGTVVRAVVPARRGKEAP